MWIYSFKAFQNEWASQLSSDLVEYMWLIPYFWGRVDIRMFGSLHIVRISVLFEKMKPAGSV